MDDPKQNKKILLCLSGGGIRAMAFHAGVLKYLAKKNLLEKIEKISTVSGGSLLMGLVYSHNNTFPTSETYLNETLPKIEELLCSTSLYWSILKLLLKKPLNLRFISSRANLLTEVLEKVWHIKLKLVDVVDSPEWSINGTNAYNGKRFRFKNYEIGDYDLGYAHPDNLKLSYALATSAAFPVGFGPLCIDTKQFKWFKDDSWSGNQENREPRVPSCQKLYLYDGGIYDNLGIEPYFDCGSNKVKKGYENNCIIVSDAGKPVESNFSRFPFFNFFRFKKIIDIISEQSRSLRIRSFSEYVKQDKSNGAYFSIKDPKFKDSDLAHRVIKYPTTLGRVNNENFRVILNHGYEVAEYVLNKYKLIDHI
ncbi:MAG: patatin-like phospholipase family protein [Sphingobacteriaceae bacterium]|nr:patatin-like phospholipase family protein [Sphingobacteriaceae bacterium]